MDYTLTMSTTDIQLKLQRHLDGLELFEKEMEVIYLLVEIRKLMEREDVMQPRHRSIKFYCDWALHTMKSRDFRGLEDVFNEIYVGCEEFFLRNTGVTPQPLSRLMYFEQLRRDLRPFFEEHNLSVAMLDNEETWVSFVKQLLGIVTDQPISKPIPLISEILVVGSNQNSAAIMIVFEEPIIDSTGKSNLHFQYRNAF